MGACIETQVRTAENDNDKASKYFMDPSKVVKEKQQAEMTSNDDEGNALIAKLKQQTQDNKEKNDLLVKQKTAIADQVSKERYVIVFNNKTTSKQLYIHSILFVVYILLLYIGCQLWPL